MIILRILLLLFVSLSVSAQPIFNTGTAKTNTAAPGRTNNGDITCDWPAGYTATINHFALMIVYSDQGSGSTPTNWSGVTGQPFGSGTEKLNVFYKILAGGESAPVTTISGSGTNLSHVCNIAIYTNAGSIGAIGIASVGTGTPMTAAQITTTDDNSMIVGVAGRGDNEDAGSQTFDGSGTGVTEQLDGGTNAGADSQVSMADKIYPTSSTATGSFSATTLASDPWVAVQIELIFSPTPTGPGLLNFPLTY